VTTSEYLLLYVFSLALSAFNFINFAFGVFASVFTRTS
jgi:hypothetical protein